MFGIESPGVYYAYLACILSTVACVIYGIINWNKGSIKEKEKKKSIKWEKLEKSINEEK